jgi:small subunit ribosomal protein S11
MTEVSKEQTVAPKKKKKAKKKIERDISNGIAHIQASFNNTIISMTDKLGNVVAWASAGKMGFKGARKSTAYAAQLVAKECGKQAMGMGMKEIDVEVNGPGSGRESAIRALQAVGLQINVIRDVTPIPHNGCRPPKKRRV